MSLLISSPESDLQAKYDRQVYNNQKLQEAVINRDNHIKALDRIIEVQEIKEKERMLIDLFGIGISKDEAVGVIFGALAIEVNPAFILGIFIW